MPEYINHCLLDNAGFSNKGSKYLNSPKIDVYSLKLERKECTSETISALDNCKEISRILSRINNAFLKTLWTFGDDTATSNNPLNTGPKLLVWEHNEQNSNFILIVP